VTALYVREQGACVHLRGSRLLVEKDGQKRLEVPLREVDRVAVFGRVQVTTQALIALLDARIPVAYFTQTCRLVGRVQPAARTGLERRVAQFENLRDVDRTLALARQLVHAKLENSRQVIEDHLSNYPEDRLDRARTELDDALAAATVAASAEQLLGAEGSGAAAYFRAFPVLNRSGFAWQGRRMHPPPDPINALLSLGYTLVCHEIESLLETEGLDAELGFLHRPQAGRPSLALDLMEPFRAPAADRLTLRLLNLQMLQAPDFAHRPGQTASVTLLPDALHKYFDEYEDWMGKPQPAAPSGLREAMRAQVASFLSWLSGKSAFSPYRGNQSKEEDSCSGSSPTTSRATTNDAGSTKP